MNKKHFHDSKGLTLTELLVTIAVIAIVAVIALPTISNVISTSNQKAADQQTTDIANFVSKWTSSGTYTYNDTTQEFTGYLDTDGDGTVDSDEAVETFGIDKDRFTVVRTDGGDGQAPASDAPSASYSSTPDDSYTVNVNTSTQVVAIPAYAPVSTSVSTYVGASSSTFNLSWQDATSDPGKATASNYVVQVVASASDLSAANVDWSTATTILTAADATFTYTSMNQGAYLRYRMDITGADTNLYYYVRIAKTNAAGVGPYGDPIKIDWDIYAYAEVDAWWFTDDNGASWQAGYIYP